MTKETDYSHEAILTLLNFERKEFLIWFVNSWLALILAVGAVIQYVNVQSDDNNRDFVAVTREGQYLAPSPKKEPSSLSKDEVEQWMLDSIFYCMTFDYQSYGFISSECNSSVFSTNTVSGSSETKGQQFQRQLKESGIIDILLTNQTSTSIDIMSSKFVDSGVRSYKEMKYQQGGQLIPKIDSRYTYEFEVVFKIDMEGQKLDAPIRYQVLVERISEALRWHGLAIRSVLSLD